MTAAEITQRVWLLGADRYAAPRELARAARVDPACLESLGILLPEDTPALLARTEFAGPIIEQAGAILEGKWRLFGRTIELSGHPDWLADPFSGARVEGTGGGIAPGLGGGAGPDIRSIWELNRLQALVTLGQAFALSGEERYATRVREIVERWSEANSYLGTLNWTVSLEAGMRALSLIQAACLCQKSEAFSDRKFRQRLAGCLYLHGRFIETHLSRGSLAQNHLAAEAAALALLGAGLSGMSRSGRWRERGMTAFDKCLLRLILEDGGPYEGSLHYLSFVCALAVTLARLGRGYGLKLSGPLRSRLAAAYRFLASATDSGGAISEFGDSDDAWPVGAPAEETGERYRRVLNLLWLYLEDEPLRHGYSPDPDSVRLFGERALAERAMPEHTAGPRLESFGASGHHVVRSPGVFLRFECGHWGAPRAYAHAHADRLSFSLFLDDLPFLIDPGTGVYLSDPEFREHFRSSAAHNTLTVDQKSQAVPLACFLYRRAAVSELTEAAEDSGCIRLAGRVRDYGGVKSLTHHRRLVLEPQARRLEIVDRLEGGAAAEVEINFIFHPDCKAGLERTGESFGLVVRQGGKVLRFDIDTRCDLGLHRAEFWPSRGWYSPGFMRREACFQATLTARWEPGEPLRTRLYWEQFPGC